MLQTLSILHFVGILFLLFAALSQCVPLESTESNSTLVKRNSGLYDLWNSVPAPKVAKGDSAKYFDIEWDKDDKWAITYLYGCTGIIISDPRFVIVAHMQEIGKGTCIPLKDPAKVQEFIEGPLIEAEAPDRLEEHRHTRVEIFYNVCQDGASKGLAEFTKHFADRNGFPMYPGAVTEHGYSGGSGTGVPNPNSPSGLAVVQWEAGVADFTRGTLKVFFGSAAGEDPLRYTIFYDENRAVLDGTALDNGTG